VTPAEQVRRLGKERAKVRACIGIARAFAGKTEGHVAVAPLDPQPIENPVEERIVPAVHDDEAGIHRRTRVGPVRYLHGAGMPARVDIPVVQVHAAAPVQKPGRGQAGDAGADHRYTEWSVGVLECWSTGTPVSVC